MSAFAREPAGKQPPRILIVRVGAMGDVIHALPAVAMLRDPLPDAHIGWAVEPRWAPLLRAEGATARDPQRMPLVDAVHPVEAKGWNKRPFSIATARSIAALRHELRAAKYDIAIDLQGTVRSAAIARMSGAPRVVGSATPRETIARRLYRTPVRVTATHVTDQAGELMGAALRELGSSDVGAQNGTSLLPRDMAAEAWWQEQQRQWCANRTPILLAATAGWGAKEWPRTHFAELAARLAADGYCVVLNTTPGAIDPATAEVLKTVQTNHPDARDAVHPLQATLPQIIAATRAMHAVVAGDTGPLHLAAALGVSTVGLFGPTDPARTGPRHADAMNLRHASSVTDHGRHADTEAGLRRIEVDAVLEALRKVLRSARS